MRKYKIAIAIALFFSIASFQSEATPSVIAKTKIAILRGVTQQQVINYLIYTEHVVLTNPVTDDGGLTWTCYTKERNGNTYFTYVYTDGTNIVGFEDYPV